MTSTVTGSASTSASSTPSTPTRPFAVVTGSSSGIGLELARQFATNGYDVLVTAEDEELAAAAAQLASTGADVVQVRADLATPDGVEDLARAITASGRPVDALALNAGIGVNGKFVDIPLEDDLRLVDLNVRSAVHLAHRVLPGMVTRGEGRVLVTSSVAATMPGPYYATYAASKAFLLSFAEALRHELEDTGVTVTALMPGPTDTEFFERAGMADTPVGRSDAKDDPAQVAEQGFQALMDGDHAVIGGKVTNKLQVAGGRLMTEPMKAAMHAKMTEPQGEDA